MILYNTLLKPLMFQIEPERAHHLTIAMARFGFSIPLLSNVIQSSLNPGNLQATRIMGLDFPNKVGLAAGFDKDGKYMDIMARLGFGFIEIGTVTPRPQVGNPKPRLFRLKKDQALINRMGFNNDGVEALRSRLQAYGDRSFVLGGNIGKNKDTPNEEAFRDYVKCFEAIRDLVDYFVVNVSSPNTPGLRALQDKEPLSKILSELQSLNHKGETKPILLKIAPDVSPEQIEDISDLVSTCNIDGIVATNTTIDRSGLSSSQTDLDKIGNGGLSGAPLTSFSSNIMQQIRRNIGPDKTVIGVGGIMSGADAKARINDGANAVQIYTGLVYKGPGLVKEIVSALA